MRSYFFIFVVPELSNNHLVFSFILKYIFYPPHESVKEIELTNPKLQKKLSPFQIFNELLLIKKDMDFPPRESTHGRRVAVRKIDKDVDEDDMQENTGYGLQGVPRNSEIS